MENTIRENFKALETKASEFNSFLRKNDLAKPIIYGLMLSDNCGKSIISLSSRENILEIMLEKEENAHFDIELIPMFINAIQLFSKEINIEKLSHFYLEGENMKILSISKNDLTFTIYLSKKCNISLIEDDLGCFLDFIIETYGKNIRKIGRFSNCKESIRCERDLKAWMDKIEKNKSIFSKKDANINLMEIKKYLSLLEKMDERTIKLEKKYALECLKNQLLEITLTRDKESLKEFKKRNKHVFTRFFDLQRKG